MALISALVLETKAISVTNTPKTLEELGLTSANLLQADIAMITVESACRLTLGGDTVITDQIGHYLAPQLDREFPGGNVVRLLKIVRIGGSDIAGFVTLAKM